MAKAKRTAAYCMTRNLYNEAIPSIKSLIVNGKPDTIYLLIEDDEFPFQHDKIKIINVKDQQFFPPTGANANGLFTYMAMMRAVLCKYLKETKVLSLDADTIIDGNIDELWDLDIKDYFFAAGSEPHHAEKYFNAGVVMYNLKKMKTIVDDVIDELNASTVTFMEQDILNDMCKGQILEFDPKFNCHPWSIPSEEKVIIHYAGSQHWAYLPLPEKYEKMEV